MQFSENNEFRKYFIERFDVPEEIMNNYTFWVRGKRVWAFSGEVLDIGDIEILGIKALTLGKAPKPSTAFLRIIGKYAKKNVIYLDDEQAFRFLRGENLKGSFSTDIGYVIVKSRDDVLGCGFYKGNLINQIPKKYRFVDTWI